MIRQSLIKRIVLKFLKILIGKGRKRKWKNRQQEENRWFLHLSIEVPAEGSSNEWLESVSDEDYNKLS